MHDYKGLIPEYNLQFILIAELPGMRNLAPTKLVYTHLITSIEQDCLLQATNPTENVTKVYHVISDSGRVGNVPSGLQVLISSFYHDLQALIASFALFRSCLLVARAGFTSDTSPFETLAGMLGHYFNVQRWRITLTSKNHARKTSFRQAALPPGPQQIPST